WTWRLASSPSARRNASAASDQPRPPPARRFARSEDCDVELLVQGLTPSRLLRVGECFAPGRGIGIAAKIALAAEQHRRDASLQQLFDQVQCGGGLAAPQAAQESWLLRRF